MAPQTLQPLVIAKNVTNVHAEPNNDTELVTQAIIGQPAWVMETRDSWQKVQLWDTYSGWIQSRFAMPLETLQRFPGKTPYACIKSLIVDVRKAPSAGADIVTKLPISAEVEVGEERGPWISIILPGGFGGWVRKSEINIVDGHTVSQSSPRGVDLVRQAKRFIGTPYLWGGTTPFGIDCSGFVQLVYKLNGKRLLRDADIQATADPQARPVDAKKLRKGDLVFFHGDNDAKRERITHVGMYIGDGEFIHSAGSTGVIVSPLFSGYYWDVFWGARHMRFD